MLEDCVHHWMIMSPSPDTKKVVGTCKKCGKTRDDFLNFIPNSGWANEQGRKKGNDLRKKTNLEKKSESEL